MEIIKYEQQEVLHVSFRGKFTFAEHEAFREILEQLAAPSLRQIVIQVKDVGFIDSAGMGMLLLARDEAQKHKKQLIIAGANGQPKKMFDMANFQNLFALVP